MRNSRCKCPEHGHTKVICYYTLIQGGRELPGRLRLWRYQNPRETREATLLKLGRQAMGIAASVEGRRARFHHFSEVAL